MSSISSIPIDLLLTAVLALGSSLSATPLFPHLLADVFGYRVEVMGTKDIDLPLSGGETLLIEDSRVSSLKVTAAASDEYRARVSITAWSYTAEEAEQLMDQVELKFAKEGQPSLSVAAPPAHRGENMVMELTLYVPREISLVIPEGTRNVEARGLTGNIEIERAIGTVYLEDITGNVQANHNHGSFSAFRVDGNLRLAGQSADVELDSVAGDVGITLEDGSVGASNVTGQLSITANNSPIDVSEPKGAVRIRAKHAPVLFYSGNIAASTDIMNDFGSVELHLPDGSYKLDLEVSNGLLEVHGSRASDVEGYADRKLLRTTTGQEDAELPLVKVYTSRSPLRVFLP